MRNRKLLSVLFVVLRGAVSHGAKVESMLTCTSAVASKGDFDCAPGPSLLSEDYSYA